MKEQIIKMQSYTSEFPKEKCILKVAVKTQGSYLQDCIKTQIFEEAIY